MATHPPSVSGPLRLPIDGTVEDLADFANKMSALAAVAASDQTFAVHIPFCNTPRQQPDPEAETTARRIMTSMEIRQYDAWKSGIAMPTMDWAHCSQAVHPSELQLMSQRAVAMQLTWNNDTLSAEHACWISYNPSNNYILPLLSAVIKIHNAQCDLLVRQRGRPFEELQLAALQSIQRVVDIADSDLRRYNANFKAQVKRIHRACDVLRAREHAIKAKIPGYRIRQDPINKERIAAGLKPIGADVNYMTGPHDVRKSFSAVTEPVTRKRRRDGEEESGYFGDAAGVGQ
ncbi:hypothetical protein QBC39DRAFT_373454 [Podospora conica]|nr:hypothetical protein QBC39DRAFT_373454 [Schizothecium conicum]